MPALSMVMEFSNAGGLRGLVRPQTKNNGKNSSSAADDMSTISTSNHDSKSIIKSAILTPRNSPIGKQSKAVRFNSIVKVRKISSHKLYSAKERANLWYNAEESKQIRTEAIATVKKMMRLIPVDDDINDCSRGLEFKTPKKNKIRQARKSDIIWTVLAEQDAQGGKPNGDEIVAGLYVSFSRSCAVEAARRGAMDAVAAWG